MINPPFGYNISPTADIGDKLPPPPESEVTFYFGVLKQWFEKHGSLTSLNVFNVYLLNLKK